MKQNLHISEKNMLVVAICFRKMLMTACFVDATPVVMKQTINVIGPIKCSHTIHVEFIFKVLISLKSPAGH